MDDITESVPEESVQLDQLQPDDSLIYRGVDDVLDEGYITPDDWSPAMGFGNTPAEMRQGETIDMRVKQEIPDRAAEQEGDWNPNDEPREVGRERAGRLMRVQGAGGSETLGIDVGFSGGAASAEEAAMHIISDDEDDERLE
ncbi:DUF5709 domain-containing protein [Tessaracoccus lubricantis]|uniref:DUF5709 domain-containing protein n=1 Tax=Tessaracoccus lubricantis TaxID=545543 RepID=UPI0031F1B0A2